MKGTRLLDDIFMQTVPTTQYDGICRSFTADSRAYMAHDNTSNSEGGRK